MDLEDKNSILSELESAISDVISVLEYNGIDIDEICDDEYDGEIDSDLVSIIISLNEIKQNINKIME